MDTFIFDPATNDGKIVASVKQGSLKVISGLISKKNPDSLTVEVPEGTLGYDLIITQIISSSLSLGYTDSDAVVDAGNDAETYDIGLVLNFAFPWAFISVGNSHSFNDYKKEDTTVNSNRIRSDHSMTTDIMITKALGDFFPALDPNRTLFMNLSYEKLISEANILNYDYIADSFAFSFTKSLSIMK